MVEQARSSAPAPAGPLLRGRALPVMLAVAAILFVDNVDVSALTVALPVMADELGGELGGMQSIMTAYFISSASFFLLAGSLGDRLGIRDALTCGVGLIVLSSLFGALAGSLTAVVVWRFVQGIGYSLTFSMMMLLMKRLLPADRQNVGMGIFMGVAMLSSMAGPVIGSLMTHNLGWRSLFFINVILCAPCIWVLLKNLRGGPEAPRTGASRGELIANLLLALALLAGMTLLMQLGAGPEDSALPPGVGPGLLAAATLCAAGFVALNRRLPRPIVGRALVDNRRFVAVVVLRALLQAVSYSCLFWLPIYLQLGAGHSVVDTGLILLAFTTTAAAGSFAAGALAERHGQEKVALAGHAVVLLGVAALLLGDPGASLPALLGALALLGAGFSALFTVINAALLSAIERGPEGMLVGSYYTVSYIAGSLGIAGTGFIAAQVQAGRAGAGGYVAATTALALCWLAGALASLLLSRIFPITSSSRVARETVHP